MLVGPSITLEELENHMSERVYGIKMEIAKYEKELAELKKNFHTMPKTTINDKDEEVVNPDYIKAPYRIKELDDKIRELLEQQTFMEEKLLELEDIEERSVGLGNIKKSETKITLSLNDCLKLGFEPKQEE